MKNYFVYCKMLAQMLMIGVGIDIGMLTAAIVFAEGDEKMANEVAYVAGETVRPDF